MLGTSQSFKRGVVSLHLVLHLLAVDLLRGPGLRLLAALATQGFLILNIGLVFAQTGSKFR